MTGKGDPQQPVYSAQDARQGEIILRTRARRAIFIGGLIGMVLLALFAAIIGFATA
jgi:hypothetical protein